MINLSAFKAYDVRGRIPDEINPDLIYQIGRAYAAFVNPKKVAVGRDIRLTSEEFAQALIRGLTDSGVDVVDIGLIETSVCAVPRECISPLSTTNSTAG